MARIASFHLVREPAWKAPLALARLGTDRLRLPRVDGLVFWRLLGTGRGDSTAAGIEPARTAMFAVWETADDLDRFLAGHPVPQRWRHAEEHWSVRLRALGGHGTWRGFDPLDGLEEGDASGPVAVVTRADVRWRAWQRFAHARGPVNSELHTATGLLDVVGIGEAPVGRQATFSLWESADAARAFARSMPGHVDVIRRTRDEGWYGEEMFAWFEPYASVGEWNGRDPLGGG